MLKGSIAGIDVHKRVLMVAVRMGGDPEESAEAMRFEHRRFGTTCGELLHLAAWLQTRKVDMVVMESTAQYWKPVWLALEPHVQQRLAQAWSNRAPRGKKSDFKDAERLVRRYQAEELSLSFVPDAEQRQMRTVTRRHTQLTRDRVRIQNQTEALLEETRLKLSSMVSDLFGASGLRILEAVAEGETNPAKLAALADARVQCSEEELVDALTGSVSGIHRKLLHQYLEQVRLIDRQLEELSELAASTMCGHQDAVSRLARIPGIRVKAACQIIAEIGPQAHAFDSAPQLACWAGASPGREESAGENRSSRCPKGNRFLRRILCQAAQSAVRTQNSIFQQKFQRLVPRLGYPKSIWAIAHHLCLVIWHVLHEGEEYIERGGAPTLQSAKRRLQRLTKEMRALGYSVQVTPLIAEQSRA